MDLVFVECFADLHGGQGRVLVVVTILLILLFSSSTPWPNHGRIEWQKLHNK